MAKRKCPGGVLDRTRHRIHDRPSTTRIHSALFAGLLVVISCSANPDYAITAARFDLSCPEQELKSETLAREVYRVRGCGKQATYACDRHGMCRNYNDAAKQRAVQEFSCSAEQVAVTELSPLVFKADGCGKSKNYKCQRIGEADSCVAE